MNPDDQRHHRSHARAAQLRDNQASDRITRYRIGGGCQGAAHVKAEERRQRAESAIFMSRHDKCRECPCRSGMRPWMS